MTRKIAWIGIFAIFAAALSGCAQTAHDVAKGAAPGGIEAGVDALNSPKTQQAAVQLAQSPIVEQTGQTIARGVVQQLRVEAEQAGNSQAVRQLTHQAVLGLHDGLKDPGVTESPLFPHAKEPDSLLASMSSVSNLIIAGLVLLVFSLVAWIWVIKSRSHTSRAEWQHKETAARRLAKAIEVAERKPWGDELRGVLRSELGREFSEEIRGSSRIPSETHASGKPTI